MKTTTTGDVGGFIAAMVLSIIAVDYDRRHALYVAGGASADVVDTGPLRYRIEEELEPGSFIADLTLDAGLRRRYSPDTLALLEFRIMVPPPLPFVVDLKTGIVRTGGVVDRDSLMQCKDRNVCEVTLDVTVRPTSFFQIVKVTIQVDDINDNAPYFRDQRMSISIRESASVETSFSLPLASDLDSPQFGVQAYEMISETSKLSLGVTDRGGGLLDARLIVKQELDRETEDKYELQLIAYDGGQPPKSALVDITVLVLDSNDHSPVFDRSIYTVNITENVEMGRVIAKVTATDKDVGQNAVVVYHLSPQTHNMYGHLFAVDNRTGDITVVGQIDYEQAAIYQLAVVAEDLGPDTMPTDAAVVVRVIDVNDNPPSIVVSTLKARRTDSAEVAENLAAGTFVAHISVVDHDSGDNGRVRCNVSDGAAVAAFQLVERYPSELQLLTFAILDRETRDQYDVLLVCWDGGLPPNVAKKLLTVKVLDANDHPPRFTATTYSATITENNEVDEVIVQVKAVDADEGGNAEFHYVLSAGVSGSFDVDSDGVIVAKAAVDREQYSSFSFTVLAVDHGTPSLTGTALVLIAVEDVNDETPVFGRSSYSFSVAENEPEGTPVGTVTAEDRDVTPHNVLRYSFASGHLVADRFAIEPETGDIFTTSVLDRESQSVYRFGVRAVDSGEPHPFTGTATVTVYVQDRNDNDPVFLFPTDSNNTVHVSNRLPLNDVVTQVVAHDADLDNNGRLTYFLYAGNENGAFIVDAQRGMLSLNIRLDDVESYEFRLTILAKDGGLPRRMAAGTLLVRVNSSIPYRSRPTSNDDDDDDGTMSSGNSSSGHNLVIVILLVGGSAVLAVTLLILIVVAARRGRRRKQSQRYKCRMEALRALTAREMAGSTSGESVPLTIASSGKGFVEQNGSVATVNGTVHYQQTQPVTDPAGVVASLDVEHDESLQSGQASNADSGNGHSELDDEERHIPSSSSSKQKGGDRRFDLPPPPPPLLSYYNDSGQPTRSFHHHRHHYSPTNCSACDGGVAGRYGSRMTDAPSPQPTVKSSRSRLQSFTPSPENRSGGVQRFFPDSQAAVDGGGASTTIERRQTTTVRVPPQTTTAAAEIDVGTDGNYSRRVDGAVLASARNREGCVV